MATPYSLFVKTADNPTIYGVSSTGNFTAFNNADQFYAAGGAKDFSNVQVRDTLNIPTGTLTGEGKAYTPTISASTLSQQTPVDLSKATTPPQADIAGATVAGAEQTSKSLQDYIKELTPTQDTATQQKYDAILGEVNNLLPGLANKSTDQLTAEQNQNLPQLKTDLANINSRILTGQAEYNQLKTSYDALSVENRNKPVTMNSIIGSEAQINYARQSTLNSKAADVGLLQAQALGLQGQVQAAQESANRAVDLKYSSLQDQINVKLQQLDLLSPILSKEEKTLAMAQAQMLNDQQAKIDEQKQAAKDNINLALSNGVTTRFYNYAGEIRNSLTGEAYSTPEQFFKAAGVTSWEQAAPMITDLGATSATGTAGAERQTAVVSGKLIDKQTGEIIADYGTGSGTKPTLTANTVMQVPKTNPDGSTGFDYFYVDENRNKIPISIEQFRQFQEQSKVTAKESAPAVEGGMDFNSF